LGYGAEHRRTVATRGLYDQLWERSAWFYEAVTNTKGMVSKTPGSARPTGAYTDAKGDWLDGGKTYRLHVGANPRPSSSGR
jgi:hypothetical protein